MKNKYIEYSTNKFLSDGIRENEYIVHHYINFIPAITIECNPPYIAGKNVKNISGWVCYH